MDIENTVLISGCPRSGTSWVHFLVASHPHTSTVRQTHLYDKYIGPIKSWLDREEQFKGADGLSAIFTEKEFKKEILAPFVKSTFDRITSQVSDSSVVVEKTPSNILHHSLIHELQPKAKMLVVIRDPRAVFSSFKHGSTQDWGSWMKKNLSDFCVSWNKYQTAYLAAKSYWPEEQLKVVIYEDIKASGEQTRREIYEWIGLEMLEGIAEKALADNQNEKLRKAKEGSLQYEERSNFYRSGKVYSWVKELTFVEIKEIEEKCSDLMMLFGYKPHSIKRK